MAFYRYLEPKVQNLQYWKGEKGFKEGTAYQEGKDTKKPGPARKLDPLDEFSLVLVSLRVDLFIYDIADRFGISAGLASKICNTWINFLYYELKLIFPFPNQALIRKNMAKEFIKYSTSRIILDCTEIFSEKPSSMLAQSQTWSQYKHHNTWKILVCISPNGQVTFKSDAWSGKVSDKQITQDSRVLELLEPGDNVMVDKGFEIEDIVPPGVRVNMPPSLQSRRPFFAADTEKTMNIASVTIHVERAIQRIKTFHILDGNFPLSLAPYISQVFTVCALLTNFWSPLLPPGDEDNHLKLAK
ncbi:uncharacterized protein LOC116296006 [Actinia tenebrosa]|uniref:Uncharacterized protein LOC116296006 n=1 Tax=Actinia tenebrosa TaxID=6105 RepID=A0A6P8I4Z2_ACTTE|nr:uncharacterized protein LOC116296006 [Actinia tenebrosa]